MVHQLKGSKRGIKTVLELLRSPDDALTLSVIGSPAISATGELYDFTVDDYAVYSNFKASEKFNVTFQIRTGDNFNEEQCIASSSNYGFYLGINQRGCLVLRLGRQLSGSRVWQEVNGEVTFYSDRVLFTDTNYFITLSFDGNEYAIKVSTDGNKYTYYIAVDSSIPLDIIGGYIYIGVDRSTSGVKQPFGGSIYLAPFTVSSDNVILTQWFETLPVGEEDTFTVESDLNIGLIGAGFFTEFAKFVEKYVYPTLSAFKAKLSMKCKITFLPYTRQRVTYVASNIGSTLQNFMVEEENNRSNHVPYEVDNGVGGHEDFLVQG